MLDDSCGWVVGVVLTRGESEVDDVIKLFVWGKLECFLWQDFKA